MLHLVCPRGRAQRISTPPLICPSQWNSNNWSSLLSEGPQTSVHSVHVDYHLLFKTFLTGRVFSFRYICILKNLHLHNETSWEWDSSLKMKFICLTYNFVHGQKSFHVIFSVCLISTLSSSKESGADVSTYDLMKVFRMCQSIWDLYFQIRDDQPGFDSVATLLSLFPYLDCLVWWCG